MKKILLIIGLLLFCLLCGLARPGLREGNARDEERMEDEKNAAVLKARIETLEEANAQNKEEITRLVRENRALVNPAAGSLDSAGPSASEEVLATMKKSKFSALGSRAVSPAASRIDPERQRLANEALFRGSAARKKGDLETARRELESALELNPRLFAARAELADCLGELKDYDAAIAQHKMLAEELPFGVEPYVDMSDIYMARNDTANAAKVLNDAIALNPSAELIHERMGRIYYNEKQYDRAREEFIKELQVNPSAAESRKYLKKLERREKEARAKAKK